MCVVGPDCEENVLTKVSVWYDLSKQNKKSGLKKKKGQRDRKRRANLFYRFWGSCKHFHFSSNILRQNSHLVTMRQFFFFFFAHWKLVPIMRTDSSAETQPTDSFKTPWKFSPLRPERCTKYMWAMREAALAEFNLLMDLLLLFHQILSFWLTSGATEKHQKLHWIPNPMMA